VHVAIETLSVERCSSQRCRELVFMRRGTARVIPTFHPYNSIPSGRFKPTRPEQVPGPGTTTQIHEGSNQIQRVVIAKTLLS
jgi:hypothetical protein